MLALGSNVPRANASPTGLKRHDCALISPASLLEPDVLPASSPIGITTETIMLLTLTAALIAIIGLVLTGGGGLSDVQLFSQLKALNEIKAALGASPDPRAPELVQRVDQLLEAAFRSGRFAQL